MHAPPSRRSQERACAHARRRAQRLCRRLEARARCASVAIALTLISAPAHAQISGSVAALTDYRYRGVSLSDGNPAAQLALVYDDPSGFYGGAFVSSVRIGPMSSHGAQGIAFAGYAWRSADAIAYEVGVSYSRMYASDAPSYAYSEFYAGVASGNVSARIYYAPSYFGDSGDTLYGEINAAYPLSDAVRLIAHGGVLHSRSGQGNVYGYYYERPEWVFDARVGIAFTFDAFEAQLTGVAVSSNGAYAALGNAGRQTVVLRLAWSF
jgi:uncharacterized protein (TIGR02001 family)